MPTTTNVAQVKLNIMTRTKCEIFSRSMGFIRPVDNFNIGKRAEFEERKTFTEPNCLKRKTTEA